MHYDPDYSTEDEPPLAPEDRWFEDPADPSPSLLRDWPPYPAVPADERTRDADEPEVESIAPYLLLALAATIGLALLFHWEGR